MTDDSAAHRIRLAGPWQTQSETGEVQRTQLPLMASGTGQPLTVSRAFNGSAGMLAATRVRLRIVFQGTPPVVQLNQQELNSPMESNDKCHLEFDVTAVLNRSNTLVLTSENQADDQVTAVCLLIFEH